MKRIIFLLALATLFSCAVNPVFAQGPFSTKQGGTHIATYTKGDILYADSANRLKKLAVGSTNQVLTVAGGVPSWATPSGGGAKQWEYSGIKGAAGLAAGTTHYISVTQLLVYNDANVTTYDCSDPTNSQIDGAGYFPVGGTLKNFYFRGNVPGSGKTFTITVMKNGSATSATYVVANTDVDANGNGLKSDLTHSVTVAAGDLITYRIVTLAGANSFTGNMVSEFDSN